MLVFSLVLLGSLTTLGLYNQLSARGLLIGRARDDQLRLAATRVAAAESLLAEIHTDLLFLTRDPALARGLNRAGAGAGQADFGEQLQSLLTRSGRRYAGLCINDLAGHETCVRAQTGRVLASRGQGGPGQASAAERSGESRERFRVRIWGLQVEPPAQPGGVPTPVLNYSADLYDAAGARAGVLTLTVAAQPIFDLLIDPTVAARTIIVDRRGSYVLGPADGSLKADWPITAPDILSRPAGTIMRPAEREDAFVIFHELSFPDQMGTTAWTVIYELPIAAVLDPIDQTLQVNILLTLLLLMGGLVVAHLLTRSIVRPMRALAAAAERVGAGDLHAAIEVRSSDEIGAFSHTLAHTVDELRRTIESAEARRREAETLYAAAVALSSTLDLHRVLDLILEELRRVVPYDSSTVQLLRGDRVEILRAYGLARPETLIGTSFPLGSDDGPNGHVIRTRAPLIVDDAPLVYARFREEPYKADPIRSWLGVPLIFGDRLIGMITIDKYQPGFYRSGHARLAGAFAAQAATAIENARLYAAARDELAERLQAEERLRQAQKMEAVGRLAGGVSHDFNNILTVIMGECDLLLQDPSLKGEARDGLEQIRQAGARAAALTRQLLAFSRRQVLQPATINLNEIIAPTEQMLRRLIGEDIALRTRLSADLAAVRADPSQIEQVILNLCINGRDAMPDGGELTISTENVRLDGEGGLGPGDYVRLVVRDTGTGIDEAAQAHIFEPFFTTKPHGTGTGLGLATVHGIVQQSGGAISFSSAPGEGTSFSIYLPAVGHSRHVASIGGPAPLPLRPGAVVLLVEDDERVRHLVQQILVSCGLRVLTASDGAAARRVAEGHAGHIDLLLSDIVMPGGLNGVQLAAHMRAAFPAIKVLLMSGYTHNALSASGEVGADIGFIQKPFTPESLVEKVAEALAVPH